MTAPVPATSRWHWVALIVASTVTAVIVLFVVRALSPEWTSATAVALGVWALINAAGSTFLRRRQDRR